jgi:outer membrane protein OmpA-like peptidoglycan-associated protein
MANPERVFIDNIGNVVNTKYPEYGAIITTDESVMMFTSRRPDTEGGGMDPYLHEYFEDIYITQKVDGKWTTPKNMGKPVNSDEHDATVALSPDGSVLLIYHDDKGDGNIYQCTLKGDEWSKPKKLNKTVNSPQHESSACYTADGKTLYFVSSREGGFGEHDIYVTQWDDKKEKWSEAKNLGGVINTKYNEESVLIHPDGKTLYFSSQGHSSMGGYDIFKSELQEDGTWSTPVNLGYPVNSADDDVFFVINASGRRGYYSSVKKDGYGEKDIYMITFLGPEKPLVLNSEDNLIASIAQPVSELIVEKPVDGLTKKITLLKGMVREVGTLKPIGAELELIDVEENKTLATFQSNEKTGKYLLSLPSGKNYGLAVKAEGYLFHSENFNIPDSAAYQEIVKNIDMKPIEIGQTIVLKNIFYDYNKATLRKESINELDRLVKLLNDNPTLKIELSAHTDSRGSDAYNQKLSQERAQSVVNYLIEHGISKDRLVAKGMGETQPIYDDAYISKLPTKEEQEWAHQQNRRTEFKIIGK